MMMIIIIIIVTIIIMIMVKGRKQTKSTSLCSHFPSSNQSSAEHLTWKPLSTPSSSSSSQYHISSIIILISWACDVRDDGSSPPCPSGPFNILHIHGRAISPACLTSRHPKFSKSKILGQFSDLLLPRILGAIQYIWYSWKDNFICQTRCHSKV